MPDIVTLRQVVQSFGDALENIFQAPLPMSRRGADVRVIAGRRPYESLDLPAAVLYFYDLRPAPQRILDPIIEKNVSQNAYNVPMDRIIKPIPFDWPFQVSIYSRDFEDYLEMTQRLIAHWTDHCIVPIVGGNVGVGIDLQNITEQDVEDFGVYGRIFFYNAWVWIASIPSEFPEVLEVEWALDYLHIALEWQQQYPSSGGFPEEGVGQRVIVKAP